MVIYTKDMAKSDADSLTTQGFTPVCIQVMQAIQKLAAQGIYSVELSFLNQPLAGVDRIWFRTQGYTVQTANDVRPYTVIRWDL